MRQSTLVAWFGAFIVLGCGKEQPSMQANAQTMAGSSGQAAAGSGGAQTTAGSGGDPSPAQAGSGGANYTRLYAVLRGYLPVRGGTMVAARLAGSGMGGTPTLNARYTIPAWNDAIPILGGEQSHRALDTGRLAGRHVLFGNLEIRHDALNLGDYGALTLLAFVDAGRVFETESFSLTTNGLKVGGGGGLAVRILRASIFTFNFAGGPDGFNFSVGNGWMF